MEKQMKGREDQFRINTSFMLPADTEWLNRFKGSQSRSALQPTEFWSGEDVDAAWALFLSYFKQGILLGHLSQPAAVLASITSYEKAITAIKSYQTLLTDIQRDA